MYIYYLPIEGKISKYRVNFNIAINVQILWNHRNIIMFCEIKFREDTM